MNIAAKNDNGFCLIGISLTSGGLYQVLTTYLHSNGSFRTYGGKSHFQSRDEAEKASRRAMRRKIKHKSLEPCNLSEIPQEGRKYLKPDVDEYVSQDEMIQMMEEASREYYVVFSCVDGFESLFDEGVEYIALKDEDEDDEDAFWVYDRFGDQVLCYRWRFSSVKPTERNISMEETL